MPRHHGDRSALHAAAHRGAHPVAVRFRVRSIRRPAARCVRRRCPGATRAVCVVAPAVAEAGQPEGVAAGAGIAEHRERETARGENNSMVLYEQNTCDNTIQNMFI